MKTLINLILNDQLNEAVDFCFSQLNIRVRLAEMDMREQAFSDLSISPLVESLIKKMVVRNGKRKRMTTTSAKTPTITVRGMKYKARIAHVDASGKKKEIHRTAKQIRSKVIKMKKLWKTKLRNKVKQMVRKRAISNRIGGR